ncbi:MAG: hypothetical protein GF372_12410 [Candidatus Marinimicrobia bacterium]|nr:hypothetical protein [Candidatus Neomarinimicrobiota bacterium]
MQSEEFTTQHQNAGVYSAWGLSACLLIYLITLTLGFISLDSADDPIGNPYFTILEVLILLMMPLMVLVMIVLHFYALKNRRIFSLFALVTMIISTTITSAVHFTVLSVSRHPSFAGMEWTASLLSFEWPSIAYSLDILAWDWFFALSILTAAFVLRKGNLESAVRILMLVSGSLSLLGLIGIPMSDMQVRLIGVVGYAVVTPPLFFLLGMLFKRTPVVD